MPAFFSIAPDQVRQGFFTVGIHYERRCFLCLLIHTHVQRTVVHIGKASFRHIQLMGRYTQVKQDAVYSLYLQAA